MSKRKLKITALLTAVVILAVSLIAVAATASIDDGMFKNNTPSYITLNQSATGSINAEDDYEAYIFEIEEDGVFSLRLDHEETIDMSRVGWRVTLYKIIEGETREYREIAYYESFLNEVTSTWGETGLTKGAYCIVVRAGTYFVQSDFTLVTMFTATDIYEKEPNDTVEEATLMQVKYGKYGASSNRENDADMDWYAFELNEDSCVNLTFTHADKAFPTIGWSVTLLTEELETITQFTASLNEPLVKTGVITLEKLIELLSINPRKRFNIPLGIDYTVWDLDKDVVIKSEDFISKGKATPFENTPVKSECALTVCGGRVVYKA